MRIRVFAAVCVSLLAPGVGASAQSAVTTAVGVAYDSLHGAPLRGAFVTMGLRSAITDSLGLFRFDSVVPGTYRFTMLHDVMDSIGVSGTATRANIREGGDTVRLSVPSFPTLWRAACGATPAPSDSGFVFGVVRSASSQRRLAGASVGASWIDINPDLSQRRWQVEVDTDSIGSYALCGLPTTTGSRLRGATDSLASGFIDLLLTSTWRIQRRDLILGPLSLTDSATLGTVMAYVTTAGKPVGQAIVSTEGMPDVRTGSDGHVSIRGVPAGTRQLEVRSIGQLPALVTIDLGGGDTVRFSVDLEKATMLDSMYIRSSMMRERLYKGIEERRKTSAGYFRDSTVIARHTTITGFVRGFQSVTVDQYTERIYLPAPGERVRGSGKCLATLFIDGIMSDQENLGFFRPEDIALVEVYPRAYTTPMQFLNTRVAGVSCGSIVVWTKRFAK